MKFYREKNYIKFIKRINDEKKKGYYIVRKETRDVNYNNKYGKCAVHTVSVTMWRKLNEPSASITFYI